MKKIKKMKKVMKKVLKKVKLEEVKSERIYQERRRSNEE